MLKIAVVDGQGRGIGSLIVRKLREELGEFTPAMAEAISSSRARKILLPLNQEQVEIIGITKEPLPHIVEAPIKKIKEMSPNV